MENNNTQSAFPINGDNIQTEFGLTKREYFAGLALQGLISNKVSGFNSDKDLAQLAVSLSEELLKTLENK